jgi:hypothetical protein
MLPFPITTHCKHEIHEIKCIFEVKIVLRTFFFHLEINLDLPNHNVVV